MNEKHPMKNVVPARIVPLFAGAALLALAAPTFAQWAVRDEFPTGKLRGEHMGPHSAAIGLRASRRHSCWARRWVEFFWAVWEIASAARGRWG